MKICHSCRIAYDDKFNFCKKCGQKLSDYQEQYQDISQVPVSGVESENNTNEKTDSQKGIIIIGACIILALIGFYAFGGNFSKDKTAKIDSNSQKTTVLTNSGMPKSKVKEEVDKEAKAAAENTAKEKQLALKTSAKNNDILEVNAPGYILDDDVIVKKAPDYNSESIGTVRKGDRFFIINYTGKWAKIKGKDGVGYILKSFISTNGEDVDWSNGQKYGKEVHSAVVKATDVNMRSSNSTQSAVIGRFKQGERVKVLGFYKEWVKVQRNNGQIGFIFRTYLDY